MSAEILREAAQKMRERAEAARAVLGDNVPEWHSVTGLMGDGKTQGDAEHIASWHPAVAMAVADWLEWTAITAEFGVEPPVLALAVARAYLGGDA